MQSSMTQQLAQFKAEYATQERLGFIDTHMDGVSFFWSEASIDFSSLVYPSGIVFIRSGQKVGIFGDELLHYDSGHFLLVTVSTPLICKTIATADTPVFGFFIQTSASAVKHMVMEMGGKHALIASNSRGIEPVEMSATLNDVVGRLSDTLLSATESRILGPSLLNEILYRVLTSKHGHALYAAMNQHTTENTMSHVVDYIKQNFSQKLSVDTLASRSNMSTSRFYRTFKHMTGQSPVQFIKHIRLSKARSLIVHEGSAVNIAAEKVGYRNLSHFNRDFKEYFNVTPSCSSTSGYSAIDVV